MKESYYLHWRYLFIAIYYQSLKHCSTSSCHGLMLQNFLYPYAKFCGNSTLSVVKFSHHLPLHTSFVSDTTYSQLKQLSGQFAIPETLSSSV